MQTTSDLLTVKEVQVLLKVDRITVYRMVKDGRLTGVKIGQQWRFARDQLDSLISGERSLKSSPTGLPQVLPLHCLQSVQDVFADIAEIGSIMTAPDGVPLTRMSNPSKFCSLILASESGRRACIGSWRELTGNPDRKPSFIPCHAGLQYARACVHVSGTLVAILVAGQFHLSAPGADAAGPQIRQLAKQHGIDPKALADAARELPVLQARKQERLGKWLADIARTFEEVGCERAELMNRLQHIADVSRLSLPPGDQISGS